MEHTGHVGQFADVTVGQFTGVVKEHIGHVGQFADVTVGQFTLPLTIRSRIRYFLSSNFLPSFLSIQFNSLLSFIIKLKPK